MSDIEYLNEVAPDALNFIARPPEDVFTRTLKPLPDILPGILPTASSLYIGPGDEGKSSQLTYLETCIALELRIFDRQPRGGMVLHVMGEDGIADYTRTLTMIGQNDSRICGRGDEIAEKIVVLNQGEMPGNPRLVLEDRGGFVAGSWFDHIETVLQRYPSIRLVTLDTLSSLGLPESKGMNDAAPVYHARANAICQQYDVCILAAAHVGQSKSEGREIGMYAARGGTSLVDNARCVIQVQRHRRNDEYEPPEYIGDEFVTRWHVLKKKFSPISADNPLWTYSDNWCFESFPEHESGDLGKLREARIERRRADQREKDERIVAAAVEHHRESTRKDILAFTNGQVSRDRTNAAIDRMVKNGDLVEGGPPKNWSKSGRPPATYIIGWKKPELITTAPK